MTPSIYRKKLNYGAISRVARSLGLSRQHVCEVANGNRPSARVEEALNTEFKRIDRLVRRFEQRYEERVA